jgi:hypothetical protein
VADPVSHLLHPPRPHHQHPCHSGLDFTAQGLRHNISNPSKELADSFRDAYGNTLKPHHSFSKLGEDDSMVQAELEKWLAALEKLLAILNTFLAKKEAKW